jgi:flagellar assembly factor FliW
MELKDSLSEPNENSNIIQQLGGNGNQNQIPQDPYNPDLQRLGSPLLEIDDFFKSYPEVLNQIDPFYKEGTQKIVIDLDLINYFKKDLLRDSLCFTGEMIVYFKDSIKKKFPSLDKDHFDIQFSSASNLIEHQINSISSNRMNKFIEIIGYVGALSKISSKYSNAVFECKLCNSLTIIAQPIDGFEEPSECANKQCKSKKFILDNMSSEFIDWRYGYVQDLNFKNDLKFNLSNNLCDELEIGDKVKIFGVISVETKQSNKNNKKSMENESIYILQVNHIEKIGDLVHKTTLVKKNGMIYLDERGIHMNAINSKGDFDPETLFEWDKFEIKHRYKIENGPTKEWRFIGHINLKDTPFYFHDAGISDLKLLLQTNCAVSGKNLNFCSVPLNSYINSHHDDSKLVSEIIGFDETGWKLPFNCIFRHQDATGLEIYNNVKSVFKTEYTPDQIEEFKKGFREFYEVTGVSHKDQIFQWCLFSPFLYVYREITGLMHSQVLHSIPLTGKSSLMEAFLRFFGHFKRLLNNENVQNFGHLMGYLASSTFFMNYDEPEDTNTWIIGVMKSYLTSENKFTRHGGGFNKQFNTLEKILCAALSITCNKLISWFSDDAFLQRSYVDYMPPGELNPKWSEIKTQLPTGFLLHIIYQNTKDYTIDDLENIFKSIPFPKEIDDPRKKSIYGVYWIGQKWLKDWFGLETLISPVIGVINSSRQQNLSALISAMEEQCIRGQIRMPPFETPKPIIPFQKEEKNEKEKKQKTLDSKGENFCQEEDEPPNWVSHRYFVPYAWIKFPIATVSLNENGKVVDYLAYTLPNIHDLQDFLEGMNAKPKWNLDTLYQMLVKWFPRTCPKQRLRFLSCHNEFTVLTNVQKWVILVCKEDILPEPLETPY